MLLRCTLAVFVCYGRKCPNMVIQPHTPQTTENSKNVAIIESVLLLCFKRALNHFQGNILSRDMHNVHNMHNVFSAPNAQIR